MIKIFKSGWLAIERQTGSQEISVVRKYGTAIVCKVTYPDINRAVTKINAGPLIPVKYKTKKSLELIGEHGFYFQCYLL